MYVQKEEYQNKIAIGSYELNYVIEIIIEDVLQKDEIIVVSITTNIHTTKTTIRTIRRINVQVENSMASAIDFGKKILGFG